MTADVVQMHPDEKRREARRIGDRHPHVIRTASTSTCPPHAALLHRIAALITTEDLPEAHIVIQGRDIVVDASRCELVENAVRRWAQALELVVTEVADDGPAGIATTLWSASGWDGTGVWWHVAGSEAVAAVCESGR